MTTDKQSLANPADFHGLGEATHLAAAGETPFLKTQAALFAQFMSDKGGGMRGRERIYEKVENARISIADLLGVKTNEIGFPLNVAQGVNLVTRPIARSGGNVVMPQWEYPSAMYPWITGTDLQVRLVPADNYQIDLDRFAAMVDRDTRAIVVSLVSYYTGERIDLSAFREMADRHGAMLIVDMSHALGAGQFDVTLTDFAFGCGYKWALGTHGAGIGYCNAARQPHWAPADSGWTSIKWVDAGVRDLTALPVEDGRRFELGNPAALCVQILGAGIDYLRSYGPAAIEKHLLHLTGRLQAGLADIGIACLTPTDASRRLGIVSFTVQDEAYWRRGLEANQILAWVGDKRLRVSPHLYNSSADIERALDVIRRLNTEGA